MMLATQILYDKVCDDIDSPTEHFNMLSDTPCYDTEKAVTKIVNGKSSKQKNDVKRKLMSWFFAFLYYYFNENETIPAADEDYMSIGFQNIFADNAEFVFDNCVDCCN
ncbi:MAG: hypothetical protein II063_10365 [Prevotella sp.]|nr:hypothetical protein [Prevotella sp.]